LFFIVINSLKYKGQNMNFTHLPEDVKQAVIGLTKDKEFQRRFAEDKILDDLEAEKYNPQD